MNNYPPYQNRVVDEKSDLDERLSKLTLFTTTQNPVFLDLPGAEKSRLIRQRQIMELYSAVLEERIMWFKDSIRKPSISCSKLVEGWQFCTLLEGHEGPCDGCPF